MDINGVLRPRWLGLDNALEACGISPTKPIMSETKTVLRSLEAKYLAALQKVRELLMMEGEQPSTRTGSGVPAHRSDSKTVGQPSVPPVPMTVVRTKANAAYSILRHEGRSMHKEEIFKVMKEGGHPVKDSKSLMVAMSADPQKRFKSLGDGLWWLSESAPSTVPAIADPVTKSEGEKLLY